MPVGVNRAPSPVRVRSGGGVGSARLATLVVAVVAFLAFFYMTTKGTWNPAYQQPQEGFASNFFYAQALAIVHGHLNVSPSQLPGECFFKDGRCYGYFGLTPSLLRIPFLPILDLVGNGLTPVFLSVALTFAVVCMLWSFRLLIGHLVERPVAFIGFVGLALGPSGILLQIARPTVYEEAIAWAVAFCCLAFYCFLRWWAAPSMRWLVVLGAALVLGANSRPTVLVAAPVLALGVGVRMVQLRSSMPRIWRNLLIAGCVVGVAPVVTCLGVYWLKLGQFVPSLLGNQQIGGSNPEPWWVAIRKVDHNQLEGLRYLATSLVADLRLNAVFSTGPFPYLSFANTVVPIPFVGLPPGAMFISPVSSITDDMPLAFLAMILGVLVVAGRALLRRSIRCERVGQFAVAVCVLAGAASLYPSLTTAALINRYLGDFYPVVAIGAVWGVAVAAPSIAALPRLFRFSLASLLAMALLGEFWINFALAYVSWWR